MSGLLLMGDNLAYIFVEKENKINFLNKVKLNEEK
jgi:hypothetical protein